MTPRKRPTKAQQAIVLARQNGLCGCGCGKPLTGPLIWEHFIPLWSKGTNETGNFERWRGSCSKPKTSAEHKVRAHLDRAGKRHRGEYRPRQPMKSRQNPWPPKGARKLRSRGFEKRPDLREQAGTAVSTSL